MPRPTSVPKLTHHKASGKAVVRLSGTDVYCGPFGTPEARANYDRAVAEWLARGRQPLTVPPPAGMPATGATHSELSLNELLLEFWRHAEGHYRTPEGKPTSQLAEYRQTIRVLRELYGLQPARAFGPLALKKVRERMVLDQLSRPEVNRRVALARRVFKWAAGEELVPFEVFHRLTAVAGLQKGRTPAPDYDPVAPVGDADVESVLPLLSRHVRGLVRFMRLTGCRPGEACLLRRCDIDVSGDVWVYRPSRHKNAHRGKARAIAIGPRAQELLAEFPTPSPGSYVFSPRRSVEEQRAERAKSRRTPELPSRSGRNESKGTPAPQRAAGERYTTAVVDRAIRRAVGRANRARPGEGDAAAVPHWAPNQLRHTRGTEVRQRYGLDTAQMVLGHENAKTTEIYAERDFRLAKRAASETG